MAKYVGPYWVLDKIGSVNYRIQENDNTLPKIVHHNRMKSYTSRDVIVIPEWVSKYLKRADTTTNTSENPVNTKTTNEVVKPKVQTRPRKLVKRVTTKVNRPAKRRKPQKQPENLSQPTQLQNKSKPSPQYKTRSGRTVKPPKRD